MLPVQNINFDIMVLLQGYTEEYRYTNLEDCKNKIIKITQPVITGKHKKYNFKH